ncbi:peptidoglycan-binding domain-containing protein [Desulfobacula sp.]|uniref:peptidoglycan-binding domain-containing protein n=1 Tax=Desulfobacula sp. TaxID=2593537 RepID=UPI00263423D7|nr:peptidoglycan-binding domain-containing protein [Desulfobacula sp.]
MADPTAIFDDLGSALDQTSQKGYLPDPGLKIEQTQDFNLASSKAYIIALVSRLIDLGYLRDTTKNRSKSKMDPYVRNALGHFQTDAGLKRDKWAGPLTWNCLQQLVSFEEEQNPGAWQVLMPTNPMGFGSPALLRAVYLRLYVLGFFSWSEKLMHNTDISIHTNPHFKQALDKFLEMAWQLGLTKERLDPEISLETMGPLFSQDDLIKGIATHPEIVNAAESKPFIEAIARIELWLVGFDVNVGNPLVRLKKRQSNDKKQRSLGLSRALEEFWMQQPEKQRPKAAGRKKITPSFFTRLIMLENGVDAKPESVDPNIVDQVCSFSIRQKQDLMAKIKEVATSIWDGIKRVTRWIFQGIKKLFSKVTSTLKNLARYISRRASIHFQLVRKAFEIVHRGVVFFRQQIFPASRPEHMLIFHDKDFDMKAIANSRGDPTRTRRVLRQLRLESRCFKAACRILGHLTAIFKGVVIRLAAGTAGWFSILLALTRLGRRIADITKEVKAVLAFEVELAQSPFSNPVS